MGKDRQGNKRQDDNWGGLGTMNTKLFHFQQVQKLSLGCCYGERKHPPLSARPNRPFASWLCLWAKYPPLHKLGAQKKTPHLTGSSVNSCFMPTLSLGWQPPSWACCCWAPGKAGAPTWLRDHSLCFAWGLGDGVVCGGVLRGTQCFGWAWGPPKSLTK